MQPMKNTTDKLGAKDKAEQKQIGVSLE